MRARLHNKLVAALLAPALLVSGAAQGLLFVRCGSTVRMSCCCPKEPLPESTKLTQDLRQCCSSFALPAAVAQKVESTRPAVSAPVLVAVLGSPPRLEPSFIDEIRPAAHPDPPPGPPLLLANCTLLI